jgi:hypothetical protein
MRGEMKKTKPALLNANYRNRERERDLSQRNGVEIGSSRRL